MNCTRCNKKKETMRYIWECSTVTNNLVLFKQDIREWLNNRIKNDENFKNPDELIDELYKYTLTKIQLKDYHTEENTKYYRDKGITTMRLTYIWDSYGSLNDLIKGWIPTDLINKFKKYQKKIDKATIDNIIIEWTKKYHSFFKKIWKIRCNNLIEWECNNNITNIEKRKKKW